MDTTTKSTDAPTTDINVLPLIDVLLVLLIIFLVMLRGLPYIPAQLPAPAPAGASSWSDPQVVLELRADGSFALNGQPIPGPQLERQLHAIYDDRPVKLLFIQASDSVVYQELITAMDRARGAGVQELAWVPRQRRASRGMAPDHSPPERHPGGVR